MAVRAGSVVAVAKGAPGKLPKIISYWFARLAAALLLLLPTAALAHGDEIHPGEPIMAMWQFEPEIVAGLLIAAALYVAGVRRGAVGKWCAPCAFLRRPCCACAGALVADRAARRPCLRHPPGRAYASEEHRPDADPAFAAASGVDARHAGLAPRGRSRRSSPARAFGARSASSHNRRSQRSCSSASAGSG